MLIHAGICLQNYCIGIQDVRVDLFVQTAELAEVNLLVRYWVANTPYPNGGVRQSDVENCFLRDKIVADIKEQGL
eukprot:IDg9034t1